MEENFIDPVHFFWIGAEISPIEKLAFQSCIKAGMTPLLWCYNAFEDVTKGTIIKDASTILSRDEVKYYLETMKLPIASVSDLFRYRLLDKVGGIYSDTDIIFLKNIYTIDKPEYFCSTHEYTSDDHPNCCLMRMNKNSTISRFLVRESEERIEKYKNSIEKPDYCEFGPFVVQKCAKELNVEILPFDVINPISWRWTRQLIAFQKPDIIFFLKQFIRLLLPMVYEKKGYFITKNTIAVHLCNEMWKEHGINKSSSFHRFSIVEKLRNKILK
ncbi:glycosyltransferase [Pedobacter sp. R-06]|uniref:glycosyltransferase n=1 Tax=Pedobacter sp. R-06 TaxID=3404051 RepID=UPI003CEDBA2A